jgi:hypothetical protein
MTEKTFIGSDNISTFAKVQGSSSYVDRGDIILLWDTLDASEKQLATNIDIELKVRTNDPRSVPDRWTDDIVEEDGDPEPVDLIKQVIANPARYDVYQLLVDYDPPQPLMLWWIDKTYTDMDYFGTMAEVCRYGLFKGDDKYVWAAMAFGVDAGVGRFRWPESDSESSHIESAIEKIADAYDMRQSELRKSKEHLAEMVDPTKVDLDEAEESQLGLQTMDGMSRAESDEPANDEGGDLLEL